MIFGTRKLESPTFNPAKLADAIKMLFKVVSGVGPANHVLDGSHFNLSDYDW